MTAKKEKKKKAMAGSNERTGSQIGACAHLHSASPAVKADLLKESLPIGDQILLLFDTISEGTGIPGFNILHNTYT
jgi:hypothetical protein